MIGSVSPALNDVLSVLTDRLQPLDRVWAFDGTPALTITHCFPDADVVTERPKDPVDVTLLVNDQLVHAGVRGPAVLDAAVRGTRPGGFIVCSVSSAVPLQASGRDGGMTAAKLSKMLGERGLAIELLAAPGAYAQLQGRDWNGTDDFTADQTSGLLDSAATIIAVARTPKTDRERSEQFFASLPRRIVSASAICRTASDKILVVFDTFKSAWTIPGGLVDAGEDPGTAVIRETYEEGGVTGELGELLGVFAHSSPERINFVYEVSPTVVPTSPTALHDHEIAEVRWVSLEEAKRLLAPTIRRKLDHCLTRPGGSWYW